MSPRFHVVMVTRTCYVRVSSHQELREAADATVRFHKQHRSCGAVLRDGRTGKRYCVSDLINGGHTSDDVLDSYDRVCRRIALTVEAAS
jgi:hypothetical protein